MTQNLFTWGTEKKNPTGKTVKIKTFAKWSSVKCTNMYSIFHTSFDNMDVL